MSTPSFRAILDSIAWCIVGLTLVGSLIYCIVGVPLTFAVEHLGWFDALAPASAFMLATLHVAAYAFAIACVLTCFAATGSHMLVVLPVAVGLVVGYVVVARGLVWLVELAIPMLPWVLSNRKPLASRMRKVRVQCASHSSPWFRFWSRAGAPSGRTERRAST